MTFLSRVVLSQPTALVLISAISLAQAGCQKADFRSGSLQSTLSSTSDTEAPIQPSPSPSASPSATPAPTPLPRISFAAPVCPSGSFCPGVFKLRQPANAKLTFDWHTDDQKYLQQPPYSLLPYGIPNIDYLPTGGSLAYNPGDSSKLVYTANISQRGFDFLVFFKIERCVFDGKPVDCKYLQ